MGKYVVEEKNATERRNYGKGSGAWMGRKEVVAVVEDC